MKNHILLFYEKSDVNTGPVQLEIHNMAGQIVISQQLSANNNTVYLYGLEKSLYFAKVKYEDGQQHV